MRKKKYEKIKDLSAICPYLLTVLLKDYGAERKLIKKYYTITTHGGNKILWQVNEKNETLWTVSTDSLRRIKSGQYYYHVYGHYALSDEGVQWLKEKMVEELI